ncbi:hypothetical protein N1851_000054 [Merluccius polli]|uniref:Uncharacterized protein n=1 Tax=Merluccius polli TaxID=89951 RepID=A0AA47NCP0_MERPO|nr:hypothetical protein N1851_000054 [Merluccius polli]
MEMRISVLSVRLPCDAMDGLKPPQTLCLDSSNLSKTWKNWRDEFALYVDLAMVEADDKQKVKLFSYLVGESGRELLDTLMGDTAKDAWKIEDIITKFDDHCNPSVNEIVERYRFFTRNQGASENIDSYVTELRLLAKTCNFGTLRDSLIRDRIVCGGSNTAMRERLLRERNLTLDTCLQLCRAAELSKENVKTISAPTVEVVHAVQGAQYQRKANNTVECKFCGKTHEKSKQKCPAFGKKCAKCGRENHFAAKCKAKPEQRWKKNVSTIATEYVSDEYEDITCITETVDAVETDTSTDVDSERGKDGKEKDTVKEDTQLLYAGMLLDKGLRETWPGTETYGKEKATFGGQPRWEGPAHDYRERRHKDSPDPGRQEAPHLRCRALQPPRPEQSTGQHPQI